MPNLILFFAIDFLYSIVVDQIDKTLQVKENVD